MLGLSFGWFWVILTSKVGQTDLVFGARSGFISVDGHAILQVSEWSGYDLCHPAVGNIRDTHRQTDRETAF